MLIAFTIALAVSVADASSYSDYRHPQCNTGLKLFSLENSKAICAPLVDYMCVYECEWMSSCKKTTHWRAFKGRRTFVAGIVVSSSNLILCCASLATLTLQNGSKTDICEWRNEEVVSRQGASLRLEPVMQRNEYIRNAVFKGNPEDGTIRLRAEVCAFQVEKKLCDLKVMDSTTRKRWKLLLLRLSRGDFLKK